MKWKGPALLLGGLLLGVLLGVVVLWSSPDNPTTTNRQLPPTVGSPAGDFTLRGLDGQVYDLSDLKGTPVVINFWATWCPPCKEEMPLLEEYARKYPDQMVILGVDYQEKEDVVRAYKEEVGVTFPILLDRTGSVADTYYVRNFPMTFFVDTEGMIRAQHLGLLTEDLLVRYLQTIGIEEP